MKGVRRYRGAYTARQIAATFGLVLACLLFLYPMALMAINSFKSDAEMYMNPAGLPRAWTLESYGKIFKYHGGLWWNYVNSVVIAASSTVLAVFLSALAAFAFAKYRFRGRNLIFSLLLATMMVPPEIVIPGLYVLFAKLQWINTLRAQILPTITPVLGLFLIRQYMLDIPDSLLEAARLDGASEWRVFWQIVLPLSKPALLTVMIFTVLREWNDFMGPLIYLTSEGNRTLALGLAHLKGVQGTEWGLLMAASLLMVLPALLLFFVAQRFFIEGIALTGTKA